MAQPNTTWLFNDTVNDGANTGNASGGAGGGSSNWVVINLTNDKLMFLDSAQTDGDDGAGTKYPVVIPDTDPLEAPKTFVYDASNTGHEYQQVPLAGTTAGGQSGGNTRYVFAIYFDGATSGIPYLEAWNSNAHAASNDDFLGGGTPANSTLIGVTTTNGVPGSATWTGTPLAGSGGSNRLELDTGALGGAKNLYFNIKQVIPSTLTPQSDTAIVLTLRYLYS
jgi:hypothetical protein